ncbi:hypothetical protein KPH14_005368 [Odynerus spinipes]|uniref:Odorant receptor n=1 Tax=Odynerus spinipes TaxID=1348599 RepID=A0AAD9RCX0_9HYME|nr:hypothetical protein KPH14_005368 [Odynerus spinipes]
MKSHLKYYAINRKLMSAVGQWPYQSPYARVLFASNALFAVGTKYLLQTCALIASWTDWDMVIECSSPIVIDILCLAKYFTYVFHLNKIKMLFNTMQDTWTSFSMDKQTEILTIYAKEGHRLTRLYATVIYIAMCLYMTLPHVPYVVATVLKGDKNATRGLLYHVEQIIDVEKYYYYVLLHSYYTTFFLMTIMIASDTMLIVFIQHACGMFAAIGHQLENVQEDDAIDVNVYPPLPEDDVYHKISDGVAKHKEALEFSQTLASTYTGSLFVQTGLNVLVTTFSGVETVIYLNQPEEAFRFGITAITLTLHFWFLSVPCQKLIDHSLQLQDCVYLGNWYTISIKARRLLNLIQMRSRVPSQITAGKIYPLSLETFSTVVRTTMSYFTVLTSLR